MAGWADCGGALNATGIFLKPRPFCSHSPAVSAGVKMELCWEQRPRDQSLSLQVKVGAGELQGLAELGQGEVSSRAARAVCLKIGTPSLQCFQGR